MRRNHCHLSQQHSNVLCYLYSLLNYHMVISTPCLMLQGSQSSDRPREYICPHNFVYGGSFLPALWSRCFFNGKTTEVGGAWGRQGAVVARNLPHDCINLAKSLILIAFLLKKNAGETKSKQTNKQRKNHRNSCFFFTHYHGHNALVTCYD